MARSSLDFARRNSRRLLALAHEILEASRLDAERLQLDHEAIDLSKLTIDLAERCRPAVERAGLAFHVDCPPMPQFVHFDSGHWSTIVLRLVHTALKFTFRGSITVRLRWAGRAVRFAVIDTGSARTAASLVRRGRPPGESADAVDHRASVDPLADVRHLVALYGGNVVRQDMNPEGTMVMLWLPAGASLVRSVDLRAVRVLAAAILDVQPFVDSALQQLADAEMDAADRPAVVHDEAGDLDPRGTWVRHLITAQETERQRISRELHDSLGQEVVSLMLGFKALKASVARPAAQSTVRRLEQTAERIGRQLHDLAANLRPTALDDLGLARALANHVEDWAARSGIEADVHLSRLPTERLPAELETTVYRIVQEALTNVVKHARARRVSVLAEQRGDDLVVIVEDDGRGFEPEAARASRTAPLGIRGMKERAALVNGVVSIESAAGMGTTVAVTIPIGDMLEARHA